MRSLVVAISLAAIGCVDDQPLETGRFLVDTLNNDGAFHGITLDVAADKRSATIRDGRGVVTLSMKPRDKRRWREGCGTMTGHSRMETHDVVPRHIELRGRALQITALTSSCVGSGVELWGEPSYRRVLSFDRP